MGLSYHFKLSAPGSVSAAELEEFLKGMEVEARKMGFGPTQVLNVVFDTPERRQFARRLGGGMYVQDDRLKGMALPREDQLTNHYQESGEGRLVPEAGVVLVLTDERGCESCIGFMRWPAQVTDFSGMVLAETGLGDRWVFRDFVDTPDKR